MVPVVLVAHHQAGLGRGEAIFGLEINVSNLHVRGVMKFPLSSGVDFTVSELQHTLAATEAEVGMESRG